MKRYSMEWIDYEDAEMAEFDDGDYVLYAEAQAEIDELVEMLEKHKRQISDSVVANNILEISGDLESVRIRASAMASEGKVAIHEIEALISKHRGK